AGHATAPRHTPGCGRGPPRLGRLAALRLGLVAPRLGRGLGARRHRQLHARRAARASPDLVGRPYRPTFRLPPLTPLERQAALRPLAPRARVEAALAAGEPGAVERDAGRDARAAVGDELAVPQRRQRLVPGSVGRARNPARWVVDLVRLAAPAVRETRVDERERRVG